MQAFSIKRSVTRMATVVAVAAGLVVSSVAAAAPAGIGVTEYGAGEARAASGMNRGAIGLTEFGPGENSRVKRSAVAVIVGLEEFSPGEAPIARYLARHSADTTTHQRALAPHLLP